MLSTTTPEKTQESRLTRLSEKIRMFFSRFEFKSLAVFGLLMFIFSFYMVLPILSMTITAFDFSDLSDPANVLQYFIYCFENSTYRQGILNSLFAGLTTTIITSIIGLTVTVIFARYTFRGKKIFQLLAILPLVSPPFIGSFAVARLMARNGFLSNFIRTFIPGFVELLSPSLWGIIFMQSIHLWPLIFFNASASYSKIDPAQEEAARNLGSWGTSLYRQIILPMITPGFVAGAVLVFIWSISDLGTPIVLNFSSFAPFIVFKDIRDERRTHLNHASALVMLLLFVSIIALLFASKVVGMKEYAGEKVSGMELTRMMQRPTKPKLILILLLLVVLMFISLLPHFGIIIVSFVDHFNVGEIIPTEWTLGGVTTVIERADILAMILNSLIYSVLAMFITILFGIIVGYLIVRKKHLSGLTFVMVVIGGYIGLVLGAYLAARVPSSVLEKNIIMFAFTVIMGMIFWFIGRTLNLRTLEVFSTLPFAVPGIVLVAGYIRFFSDTTSLWGLLPAQLDFIPVLGDITGYIRGILLADAQSPLHIRFTSFWLIFVVSYSVRRMPYAVLSSTAVLRQIHESLEEVAYNLGATATTTLRRITIPLMASGILAGGVLTLITSFTEVSTSIMIDPIHPPFNPFFRVSPSSDPLTRGLYVEIERGVPTVAGVMGIVQLVVAGVGMAIAQRLLGEKTGTAFGG